MLVLKTLPRAVTSAFLVVLGTCALPAAEPLSVSQWVNPDSPGTVVGRVYAPSGDPIGGASVAITGLSSGTQVTASGTDGSYRFQNVTAGIYSISSSFDGHFATYALHVVPDEVRGADLLPSSADISLAQVDAGVVASAISRYASGGSTPSAGIQNADLVSLSANLVSDGYQVVSQVNNGIVGNLYGTGANGSQMPSGGVCNVFLTRDGAIVDRTLSAADGSFGFPSCCLGNHGIIAVGQGGIGVIGILVSKAGENPFLSQANAEGHTFASVAVAGGSASVQLAPSATSAESAASNQPPSDETTSAPPGTLLDEFGNPLPDGTPGLVDQFGNPIGGSGAGGGFGSSGGGGFAGGGGTGSGGGLGGLGALAGLGSLAALAGNDDNNGNVFTPQPVSPSGAADE